MHHMGHSCWVGRPLVSLLLTSAGSSSSPRSVWDYISYSYSDLSRIDLLSSVKAALYFLFSPRPQQDLAPLPDWHKSILRIILLISTGSNSSSQSMQDYMFYSPPDLSGIELLSPVGAGLYILFSPQSQWGQAPLLGRHKIIFLILPPTTVGSSSSP